MADDGIVVLTGGTSGIGRIATTELAADGRTVAVVGRDRQRGESLVAETAGSPGEVDFYQVDLAEQSNVRELASEIASRYDGIHALVHNAGLSTSERRETDDGIELTLAVNHLAPYLLTRELIDRLVASAPSRVVVTGSVVHERASLDFEDLQFTDGYDGLEAYGRSKLAAVAFTLELAERLPEDVTANCFHPGFIPSTNIFRNASPWFRWLLGVIAVVPFVGTTREEGARRLCRLIRDPTFGERSGVYLSDDGVTSPSTEAQDPAVRERLWHESADLVGVDPDWP